jgi:ABC-type Mn2+/Zn2+ transport system ATPase subunit
MHPDDGTTAPAGGPSRDRADDAAEGAAATPGVEGAVATSAVEARAVTVAYGDVVAIRDATFTIPAGRHTAVIGPNGSGKTTLLRVISGLAKTSGGRVDVAARRRSSGRNPGVAHVLQATRINDAVPLTVREVVTMGRYAHHGLLGRLTAHDHAAVARAMERMTVAHLANRQIVHLSGGQRQRVYVAQGLAQEAELLLLDEPVTGLDAPSLARITTVTDEEVTSGRTVVTTTHDVADAGLADHVLLVAGTVVAEGSPEDVLTQDNLAAAYGAMTFTTADGTVVIGDPHIHGPGSHQY